MRAGNILRLTVVELFKPREIEWESALYGFQNVEKDRIHGGLSLISWGDSHAVAMPKEIMP